MNSYEITGTLTRAFERNSEEDIIELKKPETAYYLRHIKDYTKNDKYWCWATRALILFHI